MTVIQLCFNMNIFISILNSIHTFLQCCNPIIVISKRLQSRIQFINVYFLICANGGNTNDSTDLIYRVSLTWHN